MRILIDCAIAVLAIFVALTGAVYWINRRAQPTLDGTIRIAGLHHPVTIIRDQRGIPHIEAADAHDLFAAEGYAMAQDRLWQMDLLRRLAQGRLAEVFGTAALRFDEQARMLGLNRVAAAETSRLSASDRELLQAFSLGVNEYIVRAGRRLPLEFRFGRYKPELWKPLDTASLTAHMYRTLTMSYNDDVEREMFLARAGPRITAEVFPDRSPLDIVPGQSYKALRSTNYAWNYPPSFGFAMPPGARLADLIGDGTRLIESVRELSPGRQGSNNWVLSGKHTLSGKPILANDPHLEYQVPGLWWAAELSAGDVHVIGVTIPGAPGIVIGHNDRIAWGVTNVGADVQDLYREKVNGGQVLTPSGWQPIQVIHERIRVRSAPDVDYQVHITRHGPIVSEGPSGALALRWSIYDPHSLDVLSTFLELARARQWSDFEQALSHYPGPAQNWVYADVDGHIGYQCAARIPLRASGDGSLPVPGDTDEFRWTGWIPFTALPRAFDPPGGIIATANGRIAPDNYGYVISRDWDAPYRTHRIYTLLTAGGHWRPSQMARIQTDVLSELDLVFARALLGAAQSLSADELRKNPTLREALRQLHNFDGRMLNTSVMPTLLVRARDQFLRRVLSSRFGQDLGTLYDWQESGVLLQALLAQRSPEWLPPSYRATGWDRLLIDSLIAVLGPDALSETRSRWGRLNALYVRNPVLTHIPLLRTFADLGPTELSGSRLTVKQNRVTLGPSMRFVADFSDWDNSTLTLFSGESGLVFSAHYRDEFKDYIGGRALPLWFSKGAVAAHRQHQLNLTP